MRRYIVLIFLIIAKLSLGQTPVLQTLVSKDVVELGDHLTISFRFNASGDNFKPPSNLSKYFRVLSGPNKSTSMTFINGAMSSNVSYSYVISPINTGKFTIEPASIESDDKIYQSQEVTIEVIEPSEAKKRQVEAEKQHEQNQIKQANKNIFLKLSVNKTSAYVGEQIIATYKLYNRARLNGIEGQRMPEFNGFYTSDIDIDNTNNHTRESINGVIYDVFTLKKTILIPLKSGKLELIPLEIDANVQIQDSKPVNTWFGPRYQYKNVSISLRSNGVKLNIKPLPAGKPDNFSGAVGNFRFTTSCTPTELNVNDAVTYSIKITGTGNLPLIEHPVPEWPQEFEVYDPKLKSNFSNKTNSISGSKTWEYLAIPRNGGDYQLPPVEFTFFNLSTKKYETIASGGYTIKVSGSAGSGGGFATGNINKQDVARLNTDIRFIHTRNPHLRTAEKRFFGTVWYYLWLLAPVFLTGLAYFLIRKQNELQADTIGLKKRKATKLAKNLLKQAQKALSDQNKMAFYDAIFKALNGYIADKLVIPIAQLNKQEIKRKLTESGVSEQTIANFTDTLDHCEMARFAPISNITDEQLLQNAQEVIVQLEDEIKA